MMMKWKLNDAQNQLNLQLPWMLQASTLAQCATISSKSTSNSTQQHFMMMN
jgi:hypothetical protein